MQDLNLPTIKHIYFIGIGGIGISAIARMMLHEGKEVSGQDMQDSEIIHELQKAGAQITIGQSYELIDKNVDLIVYTIAIENYDSELFKKLKEQKDIPVRSYPEMLHVVTEGKYTIAISGTHGKTTTTGMIAQILRDTNQDPTVIIGSLIADKETKEKSNFIAGKSKYFVVEACEYKRSFLNINPNILVITNIDNDHLDYYKDIEDIKSAFRELAMKVSEGGFVVCDPRDAKVADVVAGIRATVVDYQKFFKQDLKLKIPGTHNKKDAAAALAVADIININANEAEKAVMNFPGTWRRFEFKGTLSNGAMVYDDYAHHPTEIQATLQGFRELYSKSDGWSITIVFQPHLFSRTKLLLNEFAQSFSLADKVMLLPIYFAREEDDGSISSEILAKEINKYSNNAEAFFNFKSAEESLEVSIKNMDNKDIFVTMGAGEAYKIGDSILKKHI
jgi:UDP-N-acetylmuramate--alanine ligase